MPTRYTYTEAIECGDFIEFYEYEKPKIYDRDPEPDDSISYDGEPQDREDEERQDNSQRARKRLRRLVLANSWQHWYAQRRIRPVLLTLTCASPIFSRAEMRSELNKWRKRFAYQLRGEFGADVGKRYVYVIETQTSGRQHAHAIFFDLPYSPNMFRILKSSWGEGSVDMKAVRSIKHVGSYVAKYLSKEVRDEKGVPAYIPSQGLLQPKHYVHVHSAQFEVDAEVERVYFYRRGDIGNVKYKLIKKNSAYVNNERSNSYKRTRTVYERPRDRN
jgi:hypothetical protein